MYRVVSTGFSSYVHSSIYKGLESTLFLFLPLTKLPHPNTIYRAWCWQGVLALESVFSRTKRGRRTHFVNRRDGVQTFKLGP